MSRPNVQDLREQLDRKQQRLKELRESLYENQSKRKQRHPTYSRKIKTSTQDYEGIDNKEASSRDVISGRTANPVSRRQSQHLSRGYHRYDALKSRQSVSKETKHANVSSVRKRPHLRQSLLQSKLILQNHLAKNSFDGSEGK